MENSSIIFASSSSHKRQEFAQIFGSTVKVRLPSELGLDYLSPDETAESYRANAAIKLQAFIGKTKLPIFSDDSGLEVEALDGEPGVLSARYENLSNDESRCDRILEKLQSFENRKARFVCAIALVLPELEDLYFFTGTCDGEILSSAQGSSGFGYDPIFRERSMSVSFAELSSNQKNQISHRANASAKMIKFLKAYFEIKKREPITFQSINSIADLADL